MNFRATTNRIKLLSTRTSDVSHSEYEIAKLKSGRNTSSSDSARVLLVSRLFIMMVSVDAIKVILRV